MSRRRSRERFADRDSYEVRDGGYARIVATDGRRERLTNFVAAIVEQRVIDDGVQATRETALDVSVEDGPAVRVVVPSAQLGRVDRWVPIEVGHHAHMSAGWGNRDHVRAAIEQTSGAFPVRHVFGHSGWREIDSRWTYLSAGVCIDADGPVDGVTVELPETLDGFTLPAPPDGDAARDAVRALLGLLDVAPDAVTIPLLAATVRPPAGPSDYSLFVSGPSGAGKSELASLTQRAYGPGMHARALPGSWSSTANALERQAHVAKDAVLVVDDWLPGERANRDADRLLRAEGNRAGRARLRRDSDFQATYRPHGLIVATGEDVPEGESGESLRSRLVVVEVDRDAVDWSTLTSAQTDASRGLYAQAIASYLRWLASRLDGDGCAAGLAELRAAYERRLASGDVHPRTVRNVADLLTGLDLFVDFAVASGALGADDRVQLARRAFDTLAALVGAVDDPGARFLELLSQRLTAQRCHVTDPSGRPPPDAQWWGWRMPATPAIYAGPAPGGRHIGWLRDDVVWLRPDETYATVSELAREIGEQLPSARVVWQRLGKAGLISREPSRETWKVRRMVDGRGRLVIELAAELLHPRADDAAITHTFDQFAADLDDSTDDDPGETDPLDHVDRDRGIAPYRNDDPRRFTR